ncbi:MAG: glycosyltransferase family 2 protein [Balneolaceae bacterium]|nr:glycosyltransferase family 2 protein [Balneolaceae bacterium]
MKGFSIIIVTWNGLHHLKKFLPSVAATDYPNYEIIIADNASSDGTKKWVKKNYPNIKIAALDQNYGYCGGNNKAVPFTEKEILLFLNNDVEVTPNWLHGINKAFEDEQVAAVQPKMRAYNEPEFFEYAGAAGGFIDKYGYTFCRGRMFDTLEKDHGQYDTSIDIFWASGAALAIRKNLFIETGGFDEDFEFHMEEIDLCWRIQNLGYTISYAPESVVYHLGGGSLAMGDPRKVYYNFRNSLAMLWKNYSTSSLFTRFPVRFALDIIAAKKALISTNTGEYKAIFKAHMFFLKHLPSIHKKRKQLLKNRTQDGNPETMVNTNVVFRYFLRSRKTFQELMP